MEIRLLKSSRKSHHCLGLPSAGPRCENKTTSTGTGPFPSTISQCARFAMYDVDGKKLCRQHAGYVALAYLISLNKVLLRGDEIE